MIVTIITVVLALSFLVFIHELGHFLAAKKVGVHVLEFSIGFPPKVYSKLIGKTEYLISLIPIGGYVRLKGQGIDDEDKSDPENYAAKSVAQRFLILISGPLMNLLVALVLLPLVFFIGYDIPAYLNDKPTIWSIEPNSPAAAADFRKDDLIVIVNDKEVDSWRAVQSELISTRQPVIVVGVKRNGSNVVKQLDPDLFKGEEGFGWHAGIATEIGTISEGSPAANSGVQLGDRITHLNGIALEDWSQISPLVQASKGEPIQIRVVREDRQLEFLIAPQWEESQRYWILGIGSKTVRVSETVIDSVVFGVKRAYFLTVRTFEFLFRMIAGQEKSDAVGGPIMIAKMMGEAARSGVSSLFTLVAFISLQFAIFNLLPIPALDGGHIFFLILEAVTGKTLSKNLRLSIQRVGFSLLLLLILYISVQDGAAYL
jgi:regulator of sigma E protease